MTNTHINVGGHKITTNKVGQVYTITTLENGFTGTVRWVIQNGTCFVSLSGVGRSSVPSTQPNKICDVPKAKIPAYTDCSYSSQIGRAYVEQNTTALLVCTQAGANMWFTLSYPVADDWVES